MTAALTRSDGEFLQVGRGFEANRNLTEIRWRERGITYVFVRREEP